MRAALSVHVPLPHARQYPSRAPAGCAHFSPSPVATCPVPHSIVARTAAAFGASQTLVAVLVRALAHMPVLVLVDLDALAPVRVALARVARVLVLVVLARSRALVQIPLVVLGDALRVPALVVPRHSSRH